MKTIHYQGIRVFLGILLAVLVSKEISLWWVVAIPWAALCIFGIVATIPIVILIGVAAAGAQADWMSDAFVIGLTIVTPTILAMAGSALMDFWWSKQEFASESTKAEQAGSSNGG
jgi:hypothetical protein